MKVELPTNIRLRWRRGNDDRPSYKHTAPLGPEPQTSRLGSFSFNLCGTAEVFRDPSGISRSYAQNY
jgi:hypothetical protein